MGRPIEKKYFIGTTGEGGEGVASLPVLYGNEGRYTNTVPTVTFSDPSIPGGVTAVAGDVHVYALRAYPDPANIGIAMHKLVRYCENY